MELLYKFLESDDERLEKRGLQDFCGFLEKGLTLSTEDKHRLYKLLSKFQNSNSILVRRWLYKTIGLLNDRGFLPFLRGQLREREPDDENKTWCIAAVYHLTESKCKR